MKRLTIVLFIIFFAFAIGFLLFRSGSDKMEPVRAFSGYIRTVNGDKLGIDEVQFLSGAEAKRLGALDVGCPEASIENCIPSLNNDFYIRNLNTSTVGYRLSSNASITILSNPGSPMQASTTAAAFLVNYPIQTTSLRYSQPFHFKAEGNLIIEMEEQYTP